MTLEQVDTEKLTANVEELKSAIKEFLLACPNFPAGHDIASRMGIAMANVESQLRWEVGCWKLGHSRTSKN